MRLTFGIRRVMLLGALVAAGVAARDVSAQSNSGATDLLFPIGARGVAMGAATVADQGSEGLWANPAGIARMTKAEFALDHFSTFQIPSGDAISLVMPAGVIGVFGIGARLFNFCTTEECRFTDGSGQETGVGTNTALVVGATFAATFGQHVSAGITGRVYQYSNSCSGVCNGAFATPLTPSITGLVDLGFQYRPSATGPLEFGAVLANWGRNLQVNNQAQADPLPTRIHVGVSYAPTSSSWDPALQVRVKTEIIATPGFSAEQELHAGADVGYTSAKTTLNVRAGYSHSLSSTSSQFLGPSLGFGIASGRVRLDFARIFDEFSQGIGSPPTYISIRVGL